MPSWVCLQRMMLRSRYLEFQEALTGKGIEAETSAERRNARHIFLDGY
jgi:hypothetical protein